MNTKTETKKSKGAKATTTPATNGAANGTPANGIQSGDLQKFVAMREGFMTERETLLGRLREIDGALNSIGLRGESYYGPRTPTGRVRNEMSLKEAVMKAIDGKEMYKHEILEADLILGYQLIMDDRLTLM